MITNRYQNKYNNQSQKYNGRIYHSRKEAAYALELDWRKKAKEVKDVIPQYKISIDVNGIHIANYFIDFKVILTSGRVEYHEVKGFETDVWRMKWKLCQALFPEYNFVLIK